MALTFLASALAAAPSLVVEWAKWKSPSVVFSVPVSERVVALSIDDGPSSSTASILRVLAENDAHATFFLIGTNVEARPAGARDILATGNELGHHMMRDRPSRRLTEEAFEASFDEMDAILNGLGGSHLFRPGSGWYNARMVQLAAERGYRTVLGSVYPFDAQIPSGRLASWYVLENAAPGAILIMHDGPERGARTAEVLRRVLPELRRRGYRIVTVSTLLSLADVPAAVGVGTTVSVSLENRTRPAILAAGERAR